MLKKTLITVLSLSLLLVGCSSNNSNNSTANTENSDVLRVGFVTAEGGINDQSFNQGVWEGITEATTDFGIVSKYQESAEANDYKPNIETLIDENMELIIAAGFTIGDTFTEAAEVNPDLMFAIVDVDPTLGDNDEEIEAPDNLLGIVFKQEEPSFLVGYIAGLTTETNMVGFVGGLESRTIDGFEYGYKSGVAYAAAERGVEIEIISQYVGNFSDAQKGKAIGLGMYQKGCDVIFHAAAGAGDGVIEAAKEEDKWVIGVDKDQNYMAPDNVLTSAMKNANVAVYNLIEDLSQGVEFEGGRAIYYGLKDQGAVGIAPTSANNVAADVLEKVNLIEDKIISEEIVVPTNKTEYNNFIETIAN